MPLTTSNDLYPQNSQTISKPVVENGIGRPAQDP